MPIITINTKNEKTSIRIHTNPLTCSSQEQENIVESIAIAFIELFGEDWTGYEPFLSIVLENWLLESPIAFQEKKPNILDQSLLVLLFKPKIEQYIEKQVYHSMENDFFKEQI